MQRKVFNKLGHPLVPNKRVTDDLHVITVALSSVFIDHCILHNFFTVNSRTPVVGVSHFVKVVVLGDVIFLYGFTLDFSPY